MTAATTTTVEVHHGETDCDHGSLDVFICDACKRVCCWCFGSDDGIGDAPAHCDDCHGSKRRAARDALTAAGFVPDLGEAHTLDLADGSTLIVSTSDANDEPTEALDLEAPAFLQWRGDAQDDATQRRHAHCDTLRQALCVAEAWKVEAAHANREPGKLYAMLAPSRAPDDPRTTTANIYAGGVLLGEVTLLADPSGLCTWGNHRSMWASDSLCMWLDAEDERGNDSNERIVDIVTAVRAAAKGDATR